MSTVPVVNKQAAAIAKAPAQPMQVRANQSVSLAELLGATRDLPPSERAMVQRRILADPRAWAKGEWLDG